MLERWLQPDLSIPHFEPVVRARYIWAVVRQLRSGWAGSGGAVLEFEEEIKERTGARYAVATTSGTVGLMLAITALDLRPGSTILFPAYTFVAGANAARFLGHPVELVDVRPETLCMDPRLLELGPEVGAVIFVDHNGYVGPDLKRVRELCSQAGIPLIEDAAHGLGIPTAGRVGDAGVYSLSVPKLVTTGQGGVVVTDQAGIAARCRQARDQGGGWRSQRRHENLGVNFKFNDVLAAYGSAQVRDLDRLLRRRARLWSWYREEIPILDFGQPSLWRVVHRSKDAAELIDHLSENGVQAFQYYRPVHHNPPYATGREFPVAEQLAQELVYLPSSLTLTRREVRRIAGLVNEAGRLAGI